MDNVIQLPHSEEIERVVLGTIINERNAFNEVKDLLSDDCFYIYKHKEIYKAIESVFRRGDRPDLLAVTEELRKAKSNVQAYDIVDISGCNTFDLIQHATYLSDLDSRRKGYLLFIQKANQIIDLNNDVYDITCSARTYLDDMFKDSSDNISSMDNAINGLFNQINRNCSADNEISGTPTGFSKFDLRTGGLQKSDLIIIAGETSSGKALRMNERILTPNGWVLNKDIKVGDEVASIDGEKSIVIGVYPQGVKDIYKMTFSDGRVAYSSGDHLWEVGASSFKGGNRILSTLQIKEMQDNTSAFHNRMYVPMFCGKFGERKDFVIHPYILGVLIGDGCLSRGAVFCTDDKFVLDKMRSLCKMPIRQSSDKSNKCPTYRISYGHNKKTTNIYYEELRRLGLLNHLSKDKFIPECYLDCCYEQRLELLNGLMDTDGYVSKTGGIEYSTVSERLAKDVVYLCRSLGFKCSINTHKSAIKGEVYEDHYRLNIAGVNEKKVCSLPRRERRIKGRKKVNNIIRSIEYVGNEECQCIKVSHPRELFVISDFVVTHNTSLSVSIMLNAALSGSKIAMYSMEMKKEQIASRMLSMVSGISSSEILYSHLPDDTVRMLLNKSSELTPLGIFFDDRSTSNIETIISSIISMKMKHDIDGAIIDYLQILNVNMKNGSKEQQMADAARRLKNLAKDLDIWIIALSQLNRDNQNPVPSLNRLRDSGQIAEAADIVMFVYRPEVYNKNYPIPYQNFSTKGTALIDVAKGRNIGMLNFIAGFDKNKTLFYELKEIPHSNYEDEQPF